MTETALQQIVGDEAEALLEDIRNLDRENPGGGWELRFEVMPEDLEAIEAELAEVVEDGS